MTILKSAILISGEDMRKIFILTVVVFILTACSLQGLTPVPRATTSLPQTKATLPHAPASLPTAETSLPPAPAGIPHLTVDETPLVEASVDTPNHFEFMQRLDPAVRDKHAAWKYGSPQSSLAAANNILAPFDFQLVPDPNTSTESFRLYKGNNIIVEGIANFSTPTVKADGSDVVMLMNLQNGDRLLLGSGTVGRLGAEYTSENPPLYAGNNLVETFYEDGQVVVTKNGERVFATPAEFVAEYPIQGFTVQDGHWVLEVTGEVFIDGANQNQALGYAEIFSWHLVAGQPFYFFTKTKGGEVGVSYAGRVLPYTYEQVVHNACCEASMFNPNGNDAMTWFFGLRDGMWYYVEMGVYE